MRATARRRATGPCSAVVDVVLERAQHCCELCAAGLGHRRGEDWHLHHRRPRRAGGSRAADTNSPANLLVLCPGCHGVVESRRTDALRGGWLVHSMDDPAATAVLIRAERWCYLSPDGRYVDDPPVVPCPGGGA